MSKDTLKYYLDLAKLAERGKVSAVFFADWYAGFEVYGTSMNPMLKAGHQVAHLDPLPIISAMATVTESLGLAMTMSTSYVNPYILARQFSTMDHLTGGRVAWNVVTSWSKAAAKALGKTDVIPHDERYAMADEYMDIVYKLWESSWAPDAVLMDAASGVAYDGEKVKKISHEGKYFQCHGRNQVHPGPQRTPVIFQAGTSKSGSAFAAKHAEAIFLNPIDVNEARRITTSVRTQAREAGRDGKSIKFFPCIVPFIGRTEEEAKQKYQAAIGHADPIAGLGQFCGYTGIDLSTEPLDEPFQLKNGHGQASITGVINSLNADSSEVWTPRKLGIRMAIGGLHPIPVGTPEQVADVFEEWISEDGGDCDGFNIASVVNPDSWIDVVDLLVPELQRRGIYWNDYDIPGGTLRENLVGSPHLSADHYGSQFKYPKEGPRDETAADEQVHRSKRQKRSK